MPKFYNCCSHLLKINKAIAEYSRRLSEIQHDGGDSNYPNQYIVNMVSSPENYIYVNEYEFGSFEYEFCTTFMKHIRYNILHQLSSFLKTKSVVVDFDEIAVSNETINLNPEYYAFLIHTVCKKCGFDYTVKKATFTLTSV